MPTLFAFTPAARAHAAMHRTDMLLARCRHGAAPGEPAAPAQAQWHAQQQAHFLAWLDAGGFAQTGDAIENSGIAPLFSAP